MANISEILTWTFTQEADRIPPEVLQILVPGEKPVAAYKTIRDVAVVTNKRFIIADKQGITGRKVEVYSIPFKSIDMYSSENAPGMLDVNTEMEFWTKSGHFKLNLKKDVDIRKLDQLIATYVLG
ncbi:PH domain-containing protein [Vallitaleaceae bacterium 9-2]